MPCRSEYLDHTKAELETVKAAQILIYVRTCGFGEKPSPMTLSDATAGKGSGRYPDTSNLNTYTVALCHCLKGMTKHARQLLMDAPHPSAIMLSEWWERHVEDDRRREAQERFERELEAKGTREERLEAFKARNTQLTELNA